MYFDNISGIELDKIKSEKSKYVSKSKVLRLIETSLRESFPLVNVTSLSNITKASLIAPSDLLAIRFNASSSNSILFSLQIFFSDSSI